MSRPERSTLARSTFVRSWVPLLILVVLIGLTATGVNGSSAARMRPLLGQSAASDPHLLFGTPREIRADEWAVNTPLTVLQARTGSPRNQPLLGDGVDMALSYDVPVKDGWLVLHPQQWGPVLLPLDQGFAWHWWFPLALLMLAMWWLVVTLLPGRNLLGLLLGLAAAFSPFMQWWYLAGTFLPEAYALLACTLVLRLLRGPSRRLAPAQGALLAFVLSCFALLLYPPFQIPCALVAAAFCVGYLFVAAREHGWRKALLRTLWSVGALAVAGAVTELFLIDHRAAVQAIAGSLYPGDRTVPTGGDPSVCCSAASSTAGSTTRRRPPGWPATRARRPTRCSWGCC